MNFSSIIKVFPLLIAGATVGSTGPQGFPEDSDFRASCRLSVILPETNCSDAKKRTEQLIRANVDTGTELKGTTAIHDKGDDWIWSTRLTSNKWFTDDQLFEFSEELHHIEIAIHHGEVALTERRLRGSSPKLFSAAGKAVDSWLYLPVPSCVVKSQSQSRSVSIFDQGEPYCNLWNVLSKLPRFDSPHAKFVFSCKGGSVPADPVETCARY